jgi:dTDP-glucose 4,6-dehydratase
MIAILVREALIDPLRHGVRKKTSMRILVTGGAGFIGSNLVHELLRERRTDPVEQVVSLDALTYSGRRENLADLDGDPRHVFVHGSIADEPLVGRLLSEHRIEAVLHLAAETHVDRSIDRPEPFFQTNVIGTLRLLEACRHYWSRLAGADRARFRFHHVSTDEVFGSLGPQDPPFCETTGYDPHSPYAASKAGGDHLVRACAHTYGLPVLISHSSNNYGPRQFPEKLIPLTIGHLLAGRLVPLYGDGLQRRDWLYVADHCRALELVLRRGAVGETYTIGGGAEISNLEMVRTLCRLLDRLAPRADGKSHDILISHVADRPGHDRRYAISAEKIRSHLGWRPQETLATGLEKTVRWYLENRSWSRHPREPAVPDIFHPSESFPS